MKYVIKGTDLLYNGEHYPEGSEIELSDKEAKKLSSILEPVKAGVPEKSQTFGGAKEDSKKGGNK